MRHTPENLDKYAADAAPRFRTLAKQMLDMHTPAFTRHFHPAILKAHYNTALDLLRLSQQLSDPNVFHSHSIELPDTQPPF